MNQTKPKRRGTPRPGPRAARKPTGSGPLAEIRAALNLTQADFARTIGMSARGVQKCELEGRIPEPAAPRILLRALARKHSLDSLLWPERSDESNIL